MEELERINRQIEAVQNEVAVEQRRLSIYQSVRSVSDSQRTSESVRTPPANGDGSRPLAAHAQQPQYGNTCKYVVDNSKPRTDLEYDPLSNFSAGLRPLVRDHKGRAAHYVRKKDVSSSKNDLSKVSSSEPRLAAEASPEQVDEEEGDLVIDIPPSPARKRSRARRHCDDDDGDDDDDDAAVEVKKSKPAPSVLSEAKEVKEDKPCEDDTECTPRSGMHQQGSSRSEPSDAGVFDFLTKCLEDLKSKSQDDVACSRDAKEVVAASTCDVKVRGLPEISESSQDHDHHHHQQQQPIKEDVRKITEEISPAPPHHTPTEASVPATESDTSSYISCHRLPPQAQKVEQQQQQQQHPQRTAPNYTGQPMQSVTPLPSAAFTSLGNHTEEGALIAAVHPAPLHGPSTSVQAKVTNGAEQKLPVTNHLLEAADSKNEVNSSLDEAELDYSDVDLSDSDTMEECYRIFMEDNGGGTQNNVPDTKTEMPVLPDRHVPPHLDQRIEPQVLVPLQQEPAGSGTPVFATSGTLLLRQSAPPTQSASGMKPVQACSSTQQKPAAVQPAISHDTTTTTTYMNCLPVGTTVIQVGNNLRFILPEGAYPLPIASLASAITPILTPIAPVAACHQAVLSPAAQTQHGRPRTPTHAPISNPVSGHPSAASHSVPHAALHAPAKPMAARRKAKQPPEAKEKVPHDVRQSYVNKFTELFLKTSPSVNDAFEKAVAEERSVYNRSANKLKYLSVAVNALKRLKSQSAVAAKGGNEADTQMSRGKVPLNVKALNAGDAALYESLKEYVLTEERLIENNYPFQHPEKPGCAALFADKRGTTDPLKKICSRCGATYSVNKAGKHTRKEECNYHNGKGVENRVPGGVETRYSCCQAVIGAPGCQVFKLHVHDAVSLEGYVATRPREASDEGCPGVYSLNCEMCYTTGGLELSRVTVVNSSVQVIYDTFVRPENEVIDYNTRVSGISEDDMKGIKTSLSEVQETLLSFIHADTVLIGHTLESDLCALKLIHGMVTDIPVVFPHRLGPPNKLALNTLVADHLRRIIQDSGVAHDTAEDAAACMELMLWKIKEDGKGKRF